MKTDTSHCATVYDCGNCSTPIYFSSVSRQWFHYSHASSCVGIVAVKVLIPIPLRDGGQG